MKLRDLKKVTLHNVKAEIYLDGWFIYCGKLAEYDDETCLDMEVRLVQHRPDKLIITVHTDEPVILVHEEA